MACSFDLRWLALQPAEAARPFVSIASLALLLAVAGAPGWAGAQVASYGYFTVTPDPRLCPSPLCGGFWLEAVNQPVTTCVDGSQQASCYVASADFGALEAPPWLALGAVIVRGRIEADEYPGFGNLGRLLAESAWTGATPQSVEGTAYRVRDLGIVCVTSPCFSLEARALNGTDTLALSRLDLSAVDATPEQLEAATEALQRGALLVAGTTTPDPGPAGEGLALVASQFFLPEPARPRCFSDAECAPATRCNAAELCLPPPGCEPGDPCPAVCSGYCTGTACGSNADCSSTEYCAADGLCRPDGSCRLEVDCNLPGNDYLHIQCVGHGTCESTGAGGGTCGWTCTNPMCVDLFGYDFGPCRALLGWGVVDGVCTPVSGCEADPFTLFPSPDACAMACAPAPPAVPTVGWPAALGLGLGLSGVVVGWLRRRVQNDRAEADSGDPRSGDAQPG